MPLEWRSAVVGSTNPAKLEAVRSALARLAPSCAVTGVAIDTGLPAQPFGDEQTRSGAEVRARAALASDGADAGIGLEGGVLLDGERVWLLSWVAAIDRGGTVGYGGGLRMLLPPSTARQLRAGIELGAIVDELFHVHDSKTTDGAIGLLTERYVSRADAFADLVAMALAPHLNPAIYRGG
ncbi:MAG: DUF84 family protein [Chloroflexi bacterium]|nr:DUF84 family protein [Chloroflexota bacterium]